MTHEKVYIVYVGYTPDDLDHIGAVYSNRGKAYKFLHEHIKFIFGEQVWKNRETLPKDEWWVTSTQGKKYKTYYTIRWYKVI